MNISEILSAIDHEISRLEQARSLLQSSNGLSNPAGVAGKRRGRPPGVQKQVPVTRTRTMSDEGRARIAAAQKARWAAKKKADKKAAKTSGPAPAAKKAALVQKSTALAKQAPVKKASASVKPAAAKKVAAPTKAAAAKKAAVAAKPAGAKKVAAKKGAPAAKKAAANRAAPAKTAPKKRASETSSKPTAEVKAEKPLADDAMTNAAPPEATAGA